jgi:hypothetical protein
VGPQGGQRALAVGAPPLEQRRRSRRPGLRRRPPFDVTQVAHQLPETGGERLAVGGRQAGQLLAEGQVVHLVPHREPGRRRLEIPRRVVELGQQPVELVVLGREVVHQLVHQVLRHGPHIYFR